MYMKTLMYILTAILLVSCDDNMYEFQTVEITTIASGSLFGITETSINKQCIIIASDAEWQAWESLRCFSGIPSAKHRRHFSGDTRLSVFRYFLPWPILSISLLYPILMP